MLSVHAEAGRLVAPDSAELIGVVAARKQTKSHALAAAATAVNDLLLDLASLGAAVATAAGGRQPLTWSVTSATTYADYDKQSGAVTDWVIASAQVQLTVRDFEQLDALGAALAQHDMYNTQGISWLVDADNPAWSAVRADAIAAAILKARDYATALGGELAHLEHLADVGLLNGGSDARSPMMMAAHKSTSFDSQPSDSPSLDPVPQQLVSAIEARFIMTAVSLTT
jgi:uncharacterized protein YggE